MKLLELLRQMFGKDYLNSIIGTRTNISKPIKLDKNSPFKAYSDSAFDDPKVLEYIEEKLMEYGPYALSNKNMAEVTNFTKNAERYIEARNKQAGVTEGMKSAKEPKPEAEVFDIGTKEKVGEEGIMTLKKELGLPEGVEPGSGMAKIIRDRAEINQGLKGLESKLKDFAKKTDNVDESPESFVEKTLRGMADMQAQQYSIQQEGKRRAVVRKILLMDDRVDLPKDIRKRLENMDDLKGDTEVDPLNLFEKYYLRNNKQLEVLDDVIDTAPNAKKAAEEFLSKKEKFDLNPAMEKPMVRESLDDEAVEMEETKDLGERLKDADDDPDMPEMAEGGRIGFAGGSGIKALLAMFGKKGIKTADKIEQPEFAKLKKEFEAFNKRNKKLTDEDIKDYELDLGDAETWYEEGMTVADAEKLVADRKAYEAKMLTDYKAGRLDPQSGEKGRESFLRKKMEEMEMSGDKRLMSEDEIMELVDIENRRKLNASGGLNYLMGL